MRLSCRAAALPLLAALLPAAGVHALVYRDQVGHVDFHHQLLGVPQPDASFFHSPRRDDKASLLYTLSDVGVLGAVNPSSGAVVWRQWLADDTANPTIAPETPASPNAPDTPPRGRVAAVAGEGWLAAALGPSVHAWNAVSGRNVWTADFAGDVADLLVPDDAAAAAAAADTAAAEPVARKDVLALHYERATHHTVLRRLRGNDGAVVWEHREAAATAASHHGDSIEPVLRLVASADGSKVYAVSAFPGTSAPSALRVLAVNAHSGHRLEDHSLGGSGEVHTPADVLFAGRGVVVWANSARTKLKVHVLATKQKHEFALPDGTAEVRVQTATSAAPQLHLLVHTRTVGATAHRAQVLHVDAAKGTVHKAYDLPQAPGAGAFAVSAAATADPAVFFITRITDDEMVLVDSSSHGILGRWPLSQPVPVHTAGGAAAEVVAKPGGDGYAVRATVLTAHEDWVLVRNGVRAWVRPEGLTGGVAAALADRPESAQLVRALEEEAHQSSLIAAYLHRVRRHVYDLERLPAYLQSVPSKLFHSIFSTTAAPAAAGSDAAPDVFGFHKIAILATRRGRLYGLDAASPGTVQWTTKAVDAAGAGWAVKHIHVNETSGVATIIGATAAQSVAVTIETGELVDSGLEGLVAGEIANAVVVDSDAGPWLLPVPADGHITQQIAAERCPKASLVVRSAVAADGRSGGGGGIHGVRFVVSSSAKDAACVPETTWTFVPPPGFRIVDVATRPLHDPVASIGRVLGTRAVLYKYLSPNLAVVAAVSDGASALMTFLLDTVSGQVLASATYDGVDGSKPVECLLFENTFLCTFFADYTVGGGGYEQQQTSKGYHVTVCDLFESHEPNSRGLQAAAGSGGNVSAVAPVDVVVSDADASQPPPQLLPAVKAQTWVVASRLMALAVTQTRQGITVREVLAYVPAIHGILGVPRASGGGGLLDPRRPVGRDPTPQEAEEGLVRYAPTVELDPRLVLTHERDVLGVRRMVTAPTHVESTSLVLAFGAVDVFGTRLAPSLAFDLLDKGFNKVSMLGTVVALAVGVAVLRPIIARKQIDLRWKAPL